MKASGIIMAGVLLVLTGCSKGYVIHTAIDEKGMKTKQIVTTVVDNSNWSILVGSDTTIAYPATCPESALNWKYELDKEQCTFEHRHLGGKNVGQTEIVKYVTNHETMGKKVLGGIWTVLLFIPHLLGGHGDQNQTNNVSQKNTFEDNIYPNGGHKQSN